MSDRTRVTDFSLALREVDKCLEKNDQVKRPRSWTQHTPLEHAEHIRGHLGLAENYMVVKESEGDFDDLVSVATRGLMMLETYMRSGRG